MKTLLTKLAKAKQEIMSTSMKKEGQNKFSNYNYFTPEQINKLVFSACNNNGLLTTFDLKRDEKGEYGVLTVYEVETGEKIQLEMATAIPEIKATNVAQQLGGCMTYTERYLKTSCFGIAEGHLDFDTTENTKKTAKEDEADNFNLSLGLDEVQRANTEERLKEVWGTFKELQKDPKFIAAVNKRKGELK